MKTATVLRVSDELVLPIDYVTQTAAILAQRRKGKTYTAAVFAEELYAARLPWVALDPTGAWWGLRSSADGESEGIPVVVIGGQHGDLPLDPYAGRVVADLVLDHPGWYVIDLSLLEGRPAERQFTTDFGARLHRRKMQSGMDFPLHLFIDEADLFLPQEKETRADVALLAAYAGIVRRGGLHGLGSTLISQRPALINKNALTQLDLLVLLRLVAGNDQDAVYKNYVSRFMPKRPKAAVEGVTYAEDIMDSLATLPVGDAWFLEPGADPPLIVRTRARPRRTFNSSATPKAGEKRIEPKVFAQVELDEIAAQMSETIERAKADDPVELRRRIRELEAREPRPVSRPVGDPADLPDWENYFREDGWLNPNDPDFAERAVAIVGPPVPVYTIKDLDDVWKLVEEARETADRGKQIADGLVERLDETVRPFAAAILEAAAAADRQKKVTPARRTAREEKGTSRPDPPGNGSVGTSVVPPAVRPAGGADDRRVNGPQQKILDAIAWFVSVGIPTPKRSVVAAIAKVSSKSSGFEKNLSTLRTAGLISYPSGGRLELTAEGRAAAFWTAEAPTEAELHDAVCGMVSRPQAEILRVLIARYPTPLSRDEIATAVGVSAAGSGFEKNLSTLRSFELVDYPERGYVVALPVLFFDR